MENSTIAAVATPGGRGGIGRATARALARSGISLAVTDVRRAPETLPPDEAAVYQDEVDIHLNPKIGPDYMLPGQQKTVATPGQNKKHYLAGALDAKTGRMI